MTRFLFALALGYTLTSCVESNKTTKETSTPATSIDLFINDTIVNEYSSDDYQSVLEKRDTMLKIGQEQHLLTLTTKLETSKKIVYTEVYTEDGRKHKDIYRGYDATYTFTLKNNRGSVVFSKTLSKDNFKPIIDESIVTRSNAEPAIFLGYLPTFDAFLFTMNFWVPDSDVGGQCFFMINQSGQVIENSVNTYFGGADCDGTIEIPTNQKFILTCRKIVLGNGKSIAIANKDRWQIGTKLLNDSTILVIQEFNDTTKAPNARLIDPDGKTLKSFVYRGYYEVLGYEVPMRFDTLTSQYMLLDETQKHLRIIHKRHPLTTYTVDFSAMKPYKQDQLASEMVFDLNTESSRNTFALDTLTHTFRHRKSE